MWQQVVYTISLPICVPVNFVAYVFVLLVSGGLQDPRGTGGSGNSIDWGTVAFPSYLQNKNEERTFPCSEALRSPSVDGERAAWKQADLIWQTIRYAGARMVLCMWLPMCALAPL